MDEGVRQIMVRAEVGKRLAADDDFVFLKSELEKEWGELIRKLRTTKTTDPVIAEIQGSLDTLDGVISRPETWVTEARNARKYVKEGETEEGDYSHG
jgi:hypothetical protein